jgi:hypothetical protein
MQPVELPPMAAGQCTKPVECDESGGRCVVLRGALSVQ